MNINFENQVVIVTGTAHGFGRSKFMGEMRLLSRQNKKYTNTLIASQHFSLSANQKKQVCFQLAIRDMKANITLKEEVHHKHKQAIQNRIISTHFTHTFWRSFNGKESTLGFRNRTERKPQTY